MGRHRRCFRLCHCNISFRFAHSAMGIQRHASSAFRFFHIHDAFVSSKHHRNRSLFSFPPLDNRPFAAIDRQYKWVGIHRHLCSWSSLHPRGGRYVQISAKLFPPRRSKTNCGSTNGFQRLGFQSLSNATHRNIHHKVGKVPDLLLVTKHQK